ncbi:MAG: GDP-mannose 4,6-dehydratase [Elusimicrobia bacterium]|nr:GDP-mannose 4,6-dehydratase [Elusimicrobiota bacterium]
MAKYLILGGNGIFGVHLAMYLLRKVPDAQVLCVGRNPEKSGAFSLHRGIDDRRYQYHQIHMVFEDDRLMELLEKAQPDYIVNFAALAADVASSWKYATRFYETNTVALARIADRLIGKPWLKRWLQIGSSEIYGSVAVPSTEDTPISPSSPYAVSKAAGDMHLKAIHRVRGFPMNIVWPSNAYGSGQQLYRIIPRTILACLLGRKIPLQGGGKAVKSYIHAQDLAEAIHLTLHKASAGACYNIGPERGTAIRDLVAMICDKLGKPFDSVVDMAPDRLGQDAQYVLNSSKIRRELGWKDSIDLSHGLDECIDWAKKHLDELRPLSTEVFFQA